SSSSSSYCSSSCSTDWPSSTSSPSSSSSSSYCSSSSTTGMPTTHSPGPSSCSPSCSSSRSPSSSFSSASSSSSSSSSSSTIVDITCNCGFIRKPRSCLELMHRGYNSSGVYKIAPCDQRPCDEVEVYCDMETDGGGWTVFQNRGKNITMEFNRNFKDYAHGFGDAITDFWLGNDYIHCLTSQTYTQLMVIMEDWCGKILKESYACFFVADWSSRYELRLKNVTLDSRTDSLMPHSNARFSTYDKDTANRRAQQLKGGWWHSAPYSNLNGMYRTREDSSYCCHQRNNTLMKQNTQQQSCKPDGIFWRKWHGITYSLKKTTMMLRGWDRQDGHHKGLSCHGIDSPFCPPPRSLISEPTHWNN
ncbi:unnamed protein product, partial [Meganyctiphanes norvegica]